MKRKVMMINTTGLQISKYKRMKMMIKKKRLKIMNRGKMK